jgi:hypothetical protein
MPQFEEVQYRDLLGGSWQQIRANAEAAHARITERGKHMLLIIGYDDIACHRHPDEPLLDLADIRPVMLASKVIYRMPGGDKVLKDRFSTK